MTDDRRLIGGGDEDVRVSCIRVVLMVDCVDGWCGEEAFCRNCETR